MLKLIVGIVIALFFQHSNSSEAICSSPFPHYSCYSSLYRSYFRPYLFFCNPFNLLPCFDITIENFLVHISRIYTQTLYINTSIRAYILTCTASLIDSNALLLLLFSSVTFVSSCFTSFSLDLPCHGTILMYR